MPIGFRILPSGPKVSAALIASFRELPAANVSDSMSRLSAGGPRIHPMHAGGVMCGPAFTVKSRPGDNLMLHKALDMADPGDIIVADAGGDLTNALIGELMTTHAQFRQLGGIVVNGAIRDSAAIRAGTFPVFAAGVTHRGPYRDGPGEINVPVAIDGMVIHPGDLILGDGDGFVCVPRLQAEEVLMRAKAKHDAEDRQMAATRIGKSDRSWVDATLKKLGCDIV
jgi:regulator of RNase E activity RraA